MWEEGLDFLDQIGWGLDTKPYRGKPELARLLVDASISATDRIRMAKDDREFQLSLQQLDRQLTSAAEASDLRRQSLDIQRQRLGLAEKAASDKANKPPKLSTAELKAVHAAEDELPILDNSISQLERALELNDKAFSGFGAGVRGAIGSKVGDGWVPDEFADRAGAEATSEYGSVMTSEAVAAMSAALKGATTDTELQVFMDIISDVTKPPEVRKNAINRLLELARAKKETATKRIGELRNAAPAESGRSDSGVEVGTEDGGYRYIGGDPSDEASWEMVP